MELPLVSVVIPAYNGERYIHSAIDSVLQQTYKSFEIIVVNDGSTDKTAQILQPYLHQIIYLEQENQGVAAARNYGVKVAHGELIAFLDQDDFFLPDKLAIQVSQFEQQPSLGLVSSGWCTVDAEGSRLANVEPWHHLPQLNPSAWIIWKPVFPGALLLRREWLERVHGFNSQFNQTSDVDLLLNLVSLGCQSEWTKQVTVCYRQHEKNTSRNVIEQVTELEAVLNKFFGQENLSSSLRKLEKQARYQSLVWSGWQLYRNNYIPEMIDKLKSSLSWKTSTFTETSLEWLERFSQYSREYGCEFDVTHFSHLLKWEKLLEGFK